MPPTHSVVLTCAGIGSRLGLAQTKALLCIGGRSLIAWQLELLAQVEDLRIVVGYQAADVVKEVLRFRNDAIFVYNHNYFATKTGASLFLGARHANSYVVQWDGDLLVHPEDVATLLAMPGEYLAYSAPTSEDPVFVSTGADGRVLSFGTGQGALEWTGPACIKKERIQETAGHVYTMLQDHLPLPGVQVRAQDIDTYADYQRAVAFVQSW